MSWPSSAGSMTKPMVLKSYQPDFKVCCGTDWCQLDFKKKNLMFWILKNIKESFLSGVKISARTFLRREAKSEQYWVSQSKEWHVFRAVCWYYIFLGGKIRRDDFATNTAGWEPGIMAWIHIWIERWFCFHPHGKPCSSRWGWEMRASNNFKLQSCQIGWLLCWPAAEW